MQLVGAPRALLLDAASFGFSMASPLAIRHREPAPAGPDGRPGAGLRREIAEGLRVTYRDPVLRSMAGLAATYNLFDQVMSALLVLYATTELAMAAGLIGLVVSAGGPPALAAGLLALAFVGNGFGLGLSNVLAISLRQAVTPDRLLGRMNASYRFLTYGVVPLGALLGGALGELLGLRPAVAVGAVGSLLAVPWTLARPLPGLRRMPVRPEGR